MRVFTACIIALEKYVVTLREAHDKNDEHSCEPDKGKVYEETSFCFKIHLTMSWANIL